MRIFSSLALALGLTAAPLAAATPAMAATYTIDGTHTSVLFKVSHLGIAPYWGRFNKIEGRFDYDPANAAASRLSVEIDANSIFTAEKKRDDHLKSPDFFSAKQFPKITLQSTAVKPGARPGTYVVTADLTIRGTKKPITFELTKTGEGKDPWGGERVGFEGTFTVNRLDFGVSYMPDGLGRDVTIIFAVEGVKA